MKGRDVEITISGASPEVLKIDPKDVRIKELEVENARLEKRLEQVEVAHGKELLRQKWKCENTIQLWNEDSEGKIRKLEAAWKRTSDQQSAEIERLVKDLRYERERRSRPGWAHQRSPFPSVREEKKREAQRVEAVEGAVRRAKERVERVKEGPKVDMVTVEVPMTSKSARMVEDKGESRLVRPELVASRDEPMTVENGRLKVYEEESRAKSQKRKEREDEMEEVRRTEAERRKKAIDKKNERVAKEVKEKGLISSSEDEEEPGKKPEDRAEREPEDGALIIVSEDEFSKDQPAEDFLNFFSD